MRICLVHEEYPEETNFGGIATYQKAMAEELVKQGHSVYVICRSLSNDCNYVENGVNIHRLFVENTTDQVSNYVLYREKVAALLLDWQNSNLIDIIEVPDWGAETIFFEKNRKIPLVVRLHTPLLVWLKYNKNNFGKVKHKLLEWESEMLHSADLLTCCSSALKKIIVKDFKIDNSKILVTPNPANIERFYRDDTILKENKIVYVGSLEERKGVCVFAQSLNNIFKRYPSLRVVFIGKDTIRNNKNISTIEFITSIVDKKYKSNIEFLGHIPNSLLNVHLNSSLVGVFPSLFDNFPYVVLESMAVGLHIVGSKNSGMVEMLNDNSSIYNTGDASNLALKVIEKYELALQDNVCVNNISRVKEMYSPTNVCLDMVNLYEDTINSYYGTKVSTDDIKSVLSNITSDDIINVVREHGGVANLVFRVTTSSDTYVVKKYFYKFNFDLAKELYKAYSLDNINIIKPINDTPIVYRGFTYNIFKYKKPSFKLKKNSDEFLSKLLICDRKISVDNTILDKYLKYYNFLLNKDSFGNIPVEDVCSVVNIAEKLVNNDIFKDHYLNHGDISNGNIIYSKGDYYLIDFDETSVSTPLYDFAVVIIKMFSKNGKIDISKYYYYMNVMKGKYTAYSDDNYLDAVKFYLCKILLEKYYLHTKGFIDLYSKRQLKDDYRKYLKLLNNLNNF